MVAAGEELVELNDTVRVDVDEFRARARAAREQRDPALYEQALEVYAGDLLPEDVFEEWASGSHQYDQPHQPSFDRSAGRGRNRVERTIGRLKR